MHPDPIDHPNWEVFTGDEALALHLAGHPHHFYLYNDAFPHDDTRQLLCVARANKTVHEDWYCVDDKAHTSCPDCKALLDTIGTVKKCFDRELIA